MEIKKEVRVVEVNFKCPECEIGKLMPEGRVLLTSPVKYPHKCNECDHEENLIKKYPYISYEPLQTEEPPSSLSESLRMKSEEIKKRWEDAGILDSAKANDYNIKTYNVKYNIGQEVYILVSKKIFKSKIEKIRIVHGPPYIKTETMKQMDDIEIDYLVVVNEKHLSRGRSNSYDWYNQKDVFSDKDELLSKIV